MSKSILITGGAGYIGSVITEVLCDNGYDVWVVDDLSTGNKEAIDGRAKFILGDFSDMDYWFRSRNFDFVIHLAASAHVSNSVKDPYTYYNNNTVKTIELLNKMVKYDIKNIIFSSTAAVFGEPIYNPIDEDHPTTPISPYGHSKLMIEQILKDFNRAYGINYVIFRYLCVAGATKKHGEARKEESHLIPLLIKQVLGTDKPFYVYGNDFNTRDGSGTRDYFHVLDIAKAHMLAMDNMEDIKNNIFNLGNEVGYTVFEVIDAVESLFNVKINYEIKEARDGDPSCIVADTRKAWQLMGWNQDHDLDSILMSTYEWMKNKTY